MWPLLDNPVWCPPGAEKRLLLVSFWKAIGLLVEISMNVDCGRCLDRSSTSSWSYVSAKREIMPPLSIWRCLQTEVMHNEEDSKIIDCSWKIGSVLSIPSSTLRNSCAVIEQFAFKMISLVPSLYCFFQRLLKSHMARRTVSRLVL